ncbi:MAG TPA: TetR/AcrR family transcriptional regulator [Pseudonocardiaceae bacterium]
MVGENSSGDGGTRSGSVDLESGRERVMRAAYGLFSRDGIRSVGVDTVIAEAGVAKMTLYRNFPSKEDLALAFLRRREEVWTHGWVVREITGRADTPAGQLLACFDLFDEWFRRDDFEGCAFVTILLEMHDRESPIRQACVKHLANIRTILAGVAADAGIEDPERFAAQWQILLKGAIVTAQEGNEDAALLGREMGELLLRRHGLLE